MVSPAPSPRAHSHWSLRWLVGVEMLAVVYVLSSGPVLGLAFWLRETTHDDRWYHLIWVYYPLLVWGHFHPLDWYIEWWVVDVFRTVGPG
jgi:hypothetical protein